MPDHGTRDHSARTGHPRCGVWHRINAPWLHRCTQETIFLLEGAHATGSCTCSSGLRVHRGRYIRALGHTRGNFSGHRRIGPSSSRLTVPTVAADGGGVSLRDSPGHFAAHYDHPSIGRLTTRYGAIYLRIAARFLRLIRPNPSKPAPNSAIVAGSGTSAICSTRSVRLLIDQNALAYWLSRNVSLSGRYM